jgi:hypothetical protein
MSLGELRISIVATIRQLHADLELARSLARQPAVEEPEREPAGSEVDVAVADEAARVDQATAEPEFHSAEPRVIDELPAPVMKRRRPKTKPRRRAQPPKVDPAPEHHAGHTPPLASGKRKEPVVPPPAPTAEPVDTGVQAHPEALPDSHENDSVLAIHDFVHGWCTRCGMSLEVARERGWPCDSTEVEKPRAETAQDPASSPAKARPHHFEGNWCTRCGLSRDQASIYPCN